ncbi:hypothetical protein ES692_05935 [Psychroserpens burtonensis]|uniref:Uncharacterized protein n=1 Tax=Psychroserpens burtonensis TaxID=49278 RepID=A0A5C7BAJ7_9FLAO|nr:hypothetical protein [Psychroserpens burtonensis]TXE18581.1 hypothetical protein ES692_05935 [Psychroserpens burtonensis]
MKKSKEQFSSKSSTHKEAHEEVTTDTDETEKVDKYSFDNVKKHLEALPSIESKIELIETLKAEYLQEDLVWDLDRVPFNRKCDIELIKLHRLLDLRLKIENNNESKES